MCLKLILGSHVQRFHVHFRQESTRVNQDVNYDEWLTLVVQPLQTLLVAFRGVLHGESLATYPKKLKIRQQTRGEWMTSHRSGQSSTYLR